MDQASLGVQSMKVRYLNSHMTRNSNLEKGKLPPWKGFDDKEWLCLTVDRKKNGCDGKEERLGARTDSKGKKSTLANWAAHQVQTLLFSFT